MKSQWLQLVTSYPSITFLETVYFVTTIFGRAHLFNQLNQLLNQMIANDVSHFSALSCFCLILRHSECSSMIVRHSGQSMQTLTTTQRQLEKDWLTDFWLKNILYLTDPQFLKDDAKFMPQLQKISSRQLMLLYNWNNSKKWHFI